MGLEFSGPRAMDNRGAVENAAALRGLLPAAGGPPAVRQARARATAAQWRGRAAMMLKADVPSIAYEDYLRALAIDPMDGAALDGFARTAVLAGRLPEAVAHVNEWAARHPQVAEIWVAKSKLVAASGALDAALDAARQASEIKPVQIVALEQLASLFGSIGDAEQLDVVIQKLQQLAPDHAATFYHSAVSKFLHGEFAEVVRLGARTSESDPQYVAVYDLIGAAHLKLGQPGPARDAFQTSLRFNPHDSTAYTNLGILELEAGNRPDAAGHFAEALWLDPESKTAREGLVQARQ
jgi:tetratricopeptide (TPR) repeat protein